MAERLRALIFHYHTLKPFEHLTAVSGVCLSPALATCETSQALLASVLGVFMPPTLKKLWGHIGLGLSVQ